MLQTDVLDAEAPVPQPLSKERTAWLDTLIVCKK
jgi:hypothetical protein